MMTEDKKHEYPAVVQTISDQVEASLRTLFKKNLEGPHSIKEFDIITWMKKMKIFGWEKFHGPTYITIINFYKNAEETGKTVPDGLFIFYVNRYQAQMMLDSSGVLNEVDRDKIIEKDPKADPYPKACGELARKISDSIKRALRDNGFSNCDIGDAIGYLSSNVEAVNFDQRIKYKYELKFTIDPKQVLYIDIVISVS